MLWRYVVGNEAFLLLFLFVLFFIFFPRFLPLYSLFFLTLSLSAGLYLTFIAPRVEPICLHDQGALSHSLPSLLYYYTTIYISLLLNRGIKLLKLHPRAANARWKIWEREREHQAAAKRLRASTRLRFPSTCPYNIPCNPPGLKLHGLIYTLYTREILAVENFYSPWNRVIKRFL